MWFDLLQEFVGHAYTDIDISSPELNCDASCCEFKWEDGEPTECIIPPDSEATNTRTLVDSCKEHKSALTGRGRRNERRK